MAHLKNVDTGSQALTALSVTGALSAKGGAVFNEDSADVDFRVESNDSANMLFVNGGNNQVGIGVDAASTVFHVETSTDGTGVSGDDIYVAKFYNREATDSRSYGVDIHAGSNSTDQALRCKTHDGGTQLFLVKGDGSATVANGLTLTDGNLVVASGHGIDFSATGNSAGTMSSELLDHYEEGTFSPVFQTGGNSNGISHSISSGTYTRIGNRAILNGFAVMSAKDSASLTGGNVTIGGLPFTIANDNNAYSAGAISLRNVSFADFPILSTIINTTTLDLREITNAGAQTNLTDGNLSATSYVIFNIAYRV